MAGLFIALLPGVSPTLALSFGLLFGLCYENPWRSGAQAFSKQLLKISVIGLGFGMDLNELARAGRATFLYTAIGIIFALLIGTGLGRALGVSRNTGFLIAVGTSICGGSAIAAIRPILEASDEETSVSMSTIFLLNSIALLVFPLVGMTIGLTQTQFGVWCALAIHDTSSVVGASVKYGSQALAVATATKLARALWIVPVALGTALILRRQANTKWPWFIGVFTLAVLVKSFFPGGSRLFYYLVLAAKGGLTVTLYLIGTSISRGTLKSIGWAPLWQGLILWILVAGITLAGIWSQWIAV